MAGTGSVIMSTIKQVHEKDHVPTVNVDYSSIRGKVRFSISVFYRKIQYPMITYDNL